MKPNFSLAAAILLFSTFFAGAQSPPPKQLPLPGELFLVDSRPAFLIPAKIDPAAKAKPWVWYAPTLPPYPGKEEKWMFEEFVESGIAIAGIDAGESYGSPAGNKIFNTLYREMVSRGYSKKPALLGRSRGGLQLLSWAVNHPDKVSAFAGIYPVCNLASYPGVAKAAPAYEMSAKQLEKRLKEFNPIDRLERLADANVPLFAIHGDVDTVVPLEANSHLLNERYQNLSGEIDVEIAPGQGHNMWPGFFQSERLVRFLQNRSGKAIILDSPRDHEVIQRKTKDFGEISVHGRLAETALNATMIQYRFGPRERLGEWQRLPGKIEQGRFSGAFRAPAGGWRRLEVRAVREQTVLAEAAVEHVGVGEIFVVAGQSNSANHGEEKQIPRSDRVVHFDGRFWRSAADPQPGATGDAGSFIPPLGDLVAKKFGVPIGFVSCGVGATSVREWLPKGTTFPAPPTLEGNVEKLQSGEWASKGMIYDSFREKMSRFPEKGFRAILWHQGESDANQPDPARSLTEKQYRDDLEKLIAATRKDSGWEIPWFVAQVSYHTPGDESSLAIRAAQASLWRDKIALEGPDSDALKSKYRDGGGQGVHFTGKGLRELAKRWEEKISPWLERQLEDR